MEHATLRDLRLDFRYQVYGCGETSVVDSFYNPTLERAVRYDRLSGFFSSHSLALAARGVAALIARGGKMRMVCSPHLSPNDAAAMENQEEVSSRMRLEMFFSQNFTLGENDIRRDHVSALAWMLKNGSLEMRLAVVADDTGRILPDALFHPKVGIVEDEEGNAISFSGSNNETASGWTQNQEEFKVFRSWEAGQSEFLAADRKSFDDYWNGRVRNVKCLELPTAFRDGLIRYSNSFDKEEYVRRHYEAKSQRMRAWSRLSLFPYQAKAVEAWLGNDRRLLFEMATGSGKTRCAIGCINRHIESTQERPVCVVIAAPTNDLCRQWGRELAGAIVEHAKIIYANSQSNGENWRNEISRAYSAFAMGTYRQRVLIVVTTHSTVSSEDFVSLASDMAGVSSLMFVGDEVHGMGAAVHKRGLLSRYEARLGLSATPERMFDASGTEFLREYFGNAKYEFALKDALAHDRVCPYEYHPIIVSLDAEERERYDQLSERIRKLSGAARLDAESEERLKNLLIERSLIISAAREKIPALKDLISKHAQSWGSHILAFACHKNFSQCLYLFAEAGLTTSPFTFHETNRSEILSAFAAGDVKALLAMKCLDEGIDVPNAHVAVLISSSTNPREYIQRIGRVIRKAPGKRVAHVYDFLVAPTSAHDDLILRDYERARYIAESALNSFEATEALFPQFQ